MSFEIWSIFSGLSWKRKTVVRENFVDQVFKKGHQPVLSQLMVVDYAA